jgi:solute:Na+ symporter, SSS family
MGSSGLQTLDYIVFFFYFILVAGYGSWIYWRKKNDAASSNDYFLAEGSLTWWAIGASLIASNISAEQFIGMSGSGFKMGLGISTYEWMAAATLIVVATFFMPIYLKNKIFTMPQFLNTRYNTTVSTIMAVFWLFLYIFVNLTAILYLGALAVSTISGINFNLCMYCLAIFAIIITLGGMKVIGFTDVIQVFFLIIGGLVTTYMAVTLVSTNYGTSGIGEGFSLMRQNAGDHFHMIFNRDSPHYMALPGLTVLIGGMWIVNLNYWGCNQYITQRALGAELKTSRQGILFAAFLKMLMPIIVVIPGIAAYVLHQKGMFQTEMLKDGKLNVDNAYPVLLNLLPGGLKGLSFAALTAAIVASLAGKANSISTIFTLDIYRKFIGKDTSEAKLVAIGRGTVVVAILIAIVASPYMGIDKEGGFQFIQEMTGLVSPGLFAAFFMGFFWKKTNSEGALFAIVGGFIMALLMNFDQKVEWGTMGNVISTTADTFPFGEWARIPFLDRMGYIFCICVAVMVVLGLWKPSSKGLEVDANMFKWDRTFAIGACIIIAMLIGLYTYFW